MITECGSVPNIVPDKASVWYSVRAKEREDAEDVYKRVVNIAKGAALMTETELEIEFLGGCYNTLNNKVLEDVVYRAMGSIRQEEWTEEEHEFAAKLNGYFNENKEEKIKVNNLPLGTEIHSGVLPMQNDGDGSSSDVGDVAHIVPTAFFTTACNNIGAPGRNWQITACSGHSIGIKGMIYGAKVLAKAALDIMVDSDLLEKAKREFLEKTNGKPYKSPLPDGLEVPGKNTGPICGE